MSIGNRLPKGGVPDAVTIELRLDNSGILTGKFLNPVQAADGLIRRRSTPIGATLIKPDFVAQKGAE